MIHQKIGLKSSMTSILLSQHEVFQFSSLTSHQHLSLLISPFPFLRHSFPFFRVNFLLLLAKPPLPRKCFVAQMLKYSPLLFTLETLRESHSSKQSIYLQITHMFLCLTQTSLLCSRCKNPRNYLKLLEDHNGTSKSEGPKSTS